MSAGPPSALEHVWKRDLIFSPESRDDEGRRVVVLRLGQWPPSEVCPNSQILPNFIPIIPTYFPMFPTVNVVQMPEYFPGASLRLLHRRLHPLRAGRPRGENPSGRSRDGSRLQGIRAQPCEVGTFFHQGPPILSTFQGLPCSRNFNMDMVMCINSFLCGAFPLWFRRIHIVNNPM